MPWVMTSRKKRSCLVFYIGKAAIAKIEFMPASKHVFLVFWNTNDIPEKQYPSVSEAMKAMHEHLNSPLEEKE